MRLQEKLMNGLHRIVLCVPTVIVAAAAFGLSSGQIQAAEGHGGGAGHYGPGFAGPGYRGGYGGGYGGYGRGGYGYGGYGYGGWGYGWGWGGFGLGLGLGAGYYGYPYYGYPYYPYGYPGYPYAYGYPGYSSYAGPALDPNSPVAAIGPVAHPGSAASALSITIPPIPGQEIDTSVSLIIRTAADATVWINGVKTTQTGPRREFASSGLTPGRTYTFDIRAQWVAADGRTMDLQRRIPVQAGERRSVDFNQPPSSDVTTVEPRTSQK
jgi:uncharacterized protein (TIGR03000 family)